MLIQLANYFNVSIDYLLGQVENTNQFNNSMVSEKELDDKNIPLTNQQGDKILKNALDKLGFLDKNGIITEEGSKIISEFILNNSDMLRKLLNNKK